MKSFRLATLFLCFFIIVKIYTHLDMLNQLHPYADYNKYGLTGYYYSHPHWRGNPFLIRVDEKIDLSDSDSDVFKNTQFSIKWIGFLDVPDTGFYTINIGSDDIAVLYIDGRLVLENPGIHPFREVSRRSLLNRGLHLLELRYIQAEGVAQIRLNLEQPNKLIPLTPSNPDITFSFQSTVFGQDVLFIILGTLLILNQFPIKIKFNPGLLLISIIILGGLMRFLYLGQVPGLHGDEAWSAHRSMEIIEGIRHLSGLIFYTGPALHYTLASTFSIFGINLFTLRGVVAFINTINILLMYKLTTQLYTKRIGITSAMLFATSPWHIMYSRFVLEHTFLSIFFLLLSLYLLTKPDRKIWHIIISGFLMGLGTYNYLLFLTLPVSIIVIYIICTKGKGILRKELWLGIISFAIAYSPKLYDNYRMGINLLFFTGEVGRGCILKNLWEYLSIFLNCLDGTLLYQRFCGSIDKIPIPINSILFLWAMCLIFVTKRVWRKKGLFLLTLFALNYALVIFITKIPYTRFFLIPLTLAIIIMSGKVPLSLALVAASINIFYVCNNYIAGFLRTGGRPGVFTYADTMDTNNHFMESRYLYNFIVENGIADIYANDFICGQLDFWDRVNNSVRTWSIGEPSPRKDGWLIFYNGPSLYPLEEVTTYSQKPGSPIELPQNLRDKFRIYET